MVTNELMQTDLSVWGMYQHADIVVKIVMIGLLMASVVTWGIFFGKYTALSSAKRRLSRERKALQGTTSLQQAADIATRFPRIPADWAAAALAVSITFPPPTARIKVASAVCKARLTCWIACSVQ